MITLTQAPSKEYLSETVASRLKRFSTPFLKKWNQPHFGLDRVFNDGTCIRLTSHLRLIRFCLESKLVVTAPLPPDLMNLDSFFYVIPEQLALTNPTVFEFKRRFNAGTAIDFIEKHKGYYDQYWFVSQLSTIDAVNSYINRLDEVKYFFQQFKNHVSEILDHAMNDRIVLAPTAIPSLRGLSCSKKSIDFSKITEKLDQSAFLSLTPRELECVALFTLGKTAPEVARDLVISTRTVEHHIEHIKDKLDCERKGEISKKVLQLRPGSYVQRELQKTIQKFTI